MTPLNHHGITPQQNGSTPKIGSHDSVEEYFHARLDILRYLMKFFNGGGRILAVQHGRVCVQASGALQALQATKWSRPTANISHRGGRKVREWPPASAVFRRDGPRGGGRLVPSTARGMRVRHPAGIISRRMSIFGAKDRSGPPPRRTFQQVTAELGISQEPGSPPRGPGSVLWCESHTS